MLVAVGNPVAVNPDKELRREAEERGWQTRDFRRPVRLRTQFAQRVKSPRTAIPAGALAAIALAAILVWVIFRSRGGEPD